MRKLLVAVDGSAPCIKALEYALDRRKRGERLIVLALNVQPEIVPSKFAPKAMVERYQSSEAEKALRGPKVAKLLETLEADSYVEIGDPADMIVKFARKTSCHEIVLGTRGFGRLKGLLMGSVATKVAQLADRPVILIK